MSILKSVILSSFRLTNLVLKQGNSPLLNASKLISPISSNFFSTFASNSIFRRAVQPAGISSNLQPSVVTLLPSLALKSPTVQQTRTVTKWSMNKGKRKSVKAVTQRFFRLEWGAWIRPMVGRSKRHWAKDRKRKVRSEKHVFCNATQSTLLDKMVTKYWRKRRFYVDDMYEPYHQREEYFRTAVKPH